MIDETESRIPCWLVWSTNLAGVVTMEAVALTHHRAVTYKETLLASGRKYTKVSIEPTEANHLLAADMDQLWFKMYGEEAEKRRQDEQVKIAENRRDHVTRTLTNLYNACAKLVRNVEPDTEGLDEMFKAANEARVILYC
jgi:hypothetical protein